MDIETVRTKARGYIEQARQSALARAFGWTFEVQDLTVFVTLRHRRKPEHMYLLRVTFDEFPLRAPSYVFVDHGTREDTSSAWPPNVRHGQNSEICVPGIREFHEKLHKGEERYQWDHEVYKFLSTLENIHRLMEKELDR